MGLGGEEEAVMKFRSHYPQKMAPWHTEYLKLKESEKIAEGREKVRDLLLLFF